MCVEMSRCTFRLLLARRRTRGCSFDSAARGSVVELGLHALGFRLCIGFTAKIQPHIGREPAEQGPRIARLVGPGLLHLRAGDRRKVVGTHDAALKLRTLRTRRHVRPRHCRFGCPLGGRKDATEARSRGPTIQFETKLGD